MSSQNDLTRLAKSLISYKHRPVQFVQNVIGATPDDWQAEALTALAAGDNVAIRSGHGPGKSTLLAWAIIWYLLSRSRPIVPVTAPTQHQLSDVLWAETARWLRGSKVKDLLVWTATRIGLVGSEETWYAAARTSTSPEGLAGFHSANLLYIIDEASGIPDDVMTVVRGATTTAGSQILMAGNPTKRSGHFYRAFHSDSSNWHCIRVSSEDSPRVDPSYCRDMAELYGTDSDVYRVRVLGEFPRSDTGESLISLDMARACIGITPNYSCKAGDSATMGIDVARYGDDATVYAINTNGRITLESHKSWSTTQTAARALALIEEHGVTSVRVDDTGIGGGVTDQLQSEQLTDTKIIPINFGSAGDDRYHNYASLMWGNLRDLIKSQQISLPDDPQLLEELTTRRYALTTKGKICIERKEDMRARGLSSPNKADAICLATAPVHVPAPPAILLI